MEILSKMGQYLAEKVSIFSFGRGFFEAFQYQLYPEACRYLYFYFTIMFVYGLIETKKFVYKNFICNPKQTTEY